MHSSACSLSASPAPISRLTRLQSVYLLCPLRSNLVFLVSARPDVRGTGTLAQFPIGERDVSLLYDVHNGAGVGVGAQPASCSVITGDKMAGP
jgi:hypothetical protein